MQTAARALTLVIIGLIILGLAKKPQIISSFFNGLNGTLGLLTK
jgi:hypothetical protein